MAKGMRGLALTVKEGERVSITVGGVCCWVGLSQAGGQRARLVFDAPREIPIMREAIIREAESCKQI